MSVDDFLIELEMLPEGDDIPVYSYAKRQGLSAIKLIYDWQYHPPTRGAKDTAKRSIAIEFRSLGTCSINTLKAILEAYRGMNIVNVKSAYFVLEDTAARVEVITL